MRTLRWIVVVLATSIMQGQSITGDLVVNVTDPSGSAAANAKLDLVQVATNVRLSGTTDTLGNYLFSQLKPGRYSLEVSGAGFRKENVTDIGISIGQRAQINVKLTLGAVTE